MSQDGGAARDELLRRVVEHFAANGIGDTSIRSLAASIGTSHRMLLYHFGSRESMLSAVVDAVESGGRDALADELGSNTFGVAGTDAADETQPPDPVETGLRFWRAITDQALIYGPLFYELSSHAMLGQPHATVLRERLVLPWIEALADGWRALGVAEDLATTFARLDLAMARGLLLDLLVTGDRPAVDQAMATYAREAFAARVPRAPS